MESQRSKATLSAIHQRLVYDEKRALSPLATRSEGSTRPHPEDPASYRTEFMRDRGRVFYSTCFRRLADKTQSFMMPHDARIRTRLSHSIEVAHVARQMARGLRMNEDLAEAAALGHDVGHTPFGHAGENALDALNPAGFRHYLHSLRQVDILENDGRGLNLTDTVRDAIVTHSKGKGAIVGGHSAPATVEGWLVRWSDMIAYLVHDIEDAIALDVLDPRQLPADTIRVLGSNTSERLSVLMQDMIVHNSWLADPTQEQLADALRAPEERIPRLSDEVMAAFEHLRTWMYENVYHSPKTQLAEAPIRDIMGRLYTHFREDIERVPDPLRSQGLARCDSADQIATDHLASLTDATAAAMYQSLLRPGEVALVIPSF